MIINLNKFVSVKNTQVDLTNLIPGIYFLIWVDENTQRWKKINGQYVPHKDGNYVIDHGFDLKNTVPRVLKYIGESSKPIKRLIDHYTSVDENDNRGIGPKFTHVRIIKGFKRFFYDTIRLHHETLFVRKYLPDLNSASNFTENELIILRNSNGLVTPYDLLKPYAFHARDVYRAFKAWEIEDQNYLNTELVKCRLKNRAGLIHYNKRDTTTYKNKKGEKPTFGNWFHMAVTPNHKKQKEAFSDWGKRIRKYTKLFNPERYIKIIKRDRLTSKKTYTRDFDYIKKKQAIYYQQRKNKNQQKLV
jgi:hypothetical protein